jgi:Domain of unknown function (DUF4252)
VRRRTWILTLLLVGLAPMAVVAQAPLAELPGYFPTELLDLMPAEEAAVEINLQGAMLRMIAAVAGKDDPEFATLVGALEAIRVRSGDFGPAAAAAVSEKVAEGQKWLDAHGWLPMVRVREDGEQILVYSLEHEGDLVGFTILALEEDEATAVNLIGRIDPAQLTRLIAGLDLGVLEDIDLERLGGQQ